jgi:hypothetical protein
MKFGRFVGLPLAMLISKLIIAGRWEAKSFFAKAKFEGGTNV